MPDVQEMVHNILTYGTLSPRLTGISIEDTKMAKFDEN